MLVWKDPIFYLFWQHYASSIKIYYNNLTCVIIISLLSYFIFIFLKILIINLLVDSFRYKDAHFHRVNSFLLKQIYIVSRVSPPPFLLCDNWSVSFRVSFIISSYTRERLKNCTVFTLYCLLLPAHFQNLAGCLGEEEHNLYIEYDNVKIVISYKLVHIR